ncbi:MAG: hypothetical protein RIR12_1898 [Bacteroidota bacterium]|jgi:hypothetical protein
MNTKNDIVKELTALNSSLGATVVSTPYVVPDNYFEGLAAKVLSTVKSQSVTPAAAEIMALSPLLSTLSRQMPYTVPAGYFEEISITVPLLASKKELSAEEELNTLSPLLSSISKENPYSIPAGYFDARRTTPAVAPQTASKVVAMRSGKWWKIAAAAMVAGVLITVGINSYIKNNNSPIASVAKATDAELNEFLEITNTSTETVTVAVESTTKELLKDVSDEELKSFLQETSEAGVYEESIN